MFKEKYKKLLLAIEDYSLKGTLDTIDNHNNNLISINQRFHNRTNYLTRRSTLRKLESVRSDASTISRLLGQRSGFDCKCYTIHGVAIEIDDILNQSSDYDVVEEISSPMAFRLVFFNSPSQKSCRQWRWRKMRTKLIGLEAFEESDSALNGGTRKRVGFASSISRNITRSRNRPAESSLDLCLSLSAMEDSELDTNKACFSILDEQWKLELHPHTQFDEHNDSWSGIVSFHEILTSFHATFSTEQKLRLALNVATTVLCLCPSWLSPSWTGQDILFVQREDGIFSEALVVQNSNKNSGVNASKARLILANIIEPTVFSLGIFLIELAHNKLWKDLRTDPGNDIEIPEDEDLLDLAAANAILQRAKTERLLPEERPFYKEGSFFYEAVHSCISCHFSQRKPSLSDESFRTAAFQDIICQLQYALDDFMATTSPSELSSDYSGPPSDTAFSLFDDHSTRPEGPERSDEWFQYYSDNVLKIIKSQPQIVNKRIRVAILDSGVDPMDPFIRRELKRRIKYQSFIPGLESVEDKVGHGTHTAALLLRTAQNADVYIGRITIDGKIWSSDQIAKALRWAIQEKVDIISLSFGFPHPKEIHDPIRSAIREAYASDIIVFAAAGNMGGNSRLGFPACLDDVICIGSTDGKGNKSSFTPGPYPEKKYSYYSTLGEGVESSWPRHLNKDKGVERKSGTSYATPIAAGIAATILHFMHQSPNPDKYLLSRLCSKRGMQMAIRQMIVERDGFDYIVPWELFHKLGEADIAPAILIPDFNLWPTPAAGSIVEFEETRQLAKQHDSLRVDKILQVVGRGTKWAKKDVRRSLLNAKKDKTWTDVMQIDWTTKEGMINMEEICGYTFPKHSEGQSWSRRLKYLLNRNPLSVVHDLDMRTYLRHLLAPYSPKQNYIAVKRDFSEPRRRFNSF